MSAIALQWQSWLLLLYATILGCYGGHFESKMAAKIQKSSDFDKIWFPSRFCSCELISVIVFGIGSHVMILQIISYLVIIIIIIIPLSAQFCPSLFSEMKNYHSRLLVDQKLMKLDRNNIHI